MSFLPVRGRRVRRSRSLTLATAALAALALPISAGVTSAQAADPTIASLDLVNADNGAPVDGFAPLQDGAKMNLGALDTRNLSITATTSPAVVGSVKFVLDGTTLPIEGVAPYALFGDKGGKFTPWTPTVGTHTLEATAYPASGAAGTPGATVSRTFTVSDGPVQRPYAGAIALPGTIEAENYDLGGEGVAYHDFDAANPGGLARPTEGVDLVRDATGGLAVGRTRVGEWLEYTVDVAKAGDYDLGLRFASANAGGTVHVELDGADVSGPVILRSTDGFQNWTTTWASKIALPAGDGQVLRVAFDATRGQAEIGNLSSIMVRDAVTPAPLAWPTSWSYGRDATEPRFEAAYQSLFGKVYAFGGFTGADFAVSKTYSSYDVATNTWKALGTLPARLAETHAGITSDGHYIYFGGGFSGNLMLDQQPTQTVSQALWRYDPLTNTWLQLGKLPVARGAGALVYAFGKLHYFGGNPADRFTNVGTHWVFDLTRKIWSVAAPMPDPKDHFSTAVLGTKIYAIGGEHGHDVLFDAETTVHAYDVITNTWTQVASLPAVKSHMEGMTFAADGRIFVAGGQIEGQQSSDQVFVYNPSTNNWTVLPDLLPQPRQGSFVQRIGRRVVIGLGAQFTSNPRPATWIGQVPAKE